MVPPSMSKRLVLSALMLLVGGPMLLGGAAPIGLFLLLASAYLLTLPRLHRRRSDPA